MKRTIEIEDVLQDRVDAAIASVKTELENYLNENKPDSAPCINHDLDYSGTISEIVDGAVPIQTKTIADLFYLYGDEFEKAFDDAGLGSKNDKWPNGWKPVSIYCYIQNKINEWYRDNSEEIFEEWKSKRKKGKNKDKKDKV